MIRAKLDIRKIAMMGFIGLMFLFAAGIDTNAQSRRDMEREQRRIERENARYQREQRERQRRYRNDRTDYRRAEQHVANSSNAAGYDQGFQAGQYDRRDGKYNRSNVYRDTGAYPNEGDPTSTDYIYRQGYLKGYSDGFYGVRNY